MSLFLSFCILRIFSCSFPSVFPLCTSLVPPPYCICLSFICHSPFILILLSQLSLFCSFTLCLFSQIIPHISSTLVFLIYFLFSGSPYFISFSWGFLCLPFLSFQLTFFALSYSVVSLP